jgi:amino acid permease
MPTSSKMTFRATTALCLVVAVACVIVAIVYFSKTADALPSFFPGHQTGSTHHHTKHGIAFVALAILALIGAWFSTAPAKTSPT